MIPGKSYCFLKFFNLNESINVFNAMHGKSKLGQNGVPLYLSYSVHGKNDFHVFNSPRFNILI